jgi:IS5 family transposase
MDWSISVATITGRWWMRARPRISLDDGHALGVELDAEITASDHDRVGGEDDRLQVLDGAGRLDLRHDGRRPPPRVGDLAHLEHVVGVAHEGERHVVDAEAEAEVEVDLVLLRQRGDAHAPRGQVHADSITDHARLRDGGADDGSLDRAHVEHDAAVVDEDGVAREQILGEPLVLDGHLARMSGRAVLAVLHQGHDGVHGERQGPAGEAPTADLGSTQVLEDGYGFVACLRCSANSREPARVLLVGAVRKV